MTTTPSAGPKPQPCSKAKVPNSSAHLLLLILLQPLFLALPTLAVHPPVQLRAIVGRPFTLSVAEGHAIDAEMLPQWCRFNTTARQIYGIPQLRDFGVHIISIHDNHVEVTVEEEEQDQCPADSSTTWLEIMDVRNRNNMTLDEQFQMVQALMSATRKYAEVRVADLRVFSRAYLNRYRMIHKIVHMGDEEYESVDEEDEDEVEDDDQRKKRRPDERMVLVLNISCGELTEQASEVIDAAAENGFIFQVVEGILRKNRPQLAVESTTASSTTRRTTRRVHNNQRPIVLNTLKTFHCQRRLLCRVTIDENTFVDPEDGSTSHLAISAHAIGNHSNFLVSLPGENQLEGVPLESGEYSFRLEARDRMGQANSVPFQVIVKEHSSRDKATHSYLMVLDVPLQRFLEQPQFLREFVYRLGAAVHRISDTEAAAESGTKLSRIATEIQLEELLDNGANQTMLKWSNATLSRKICDDRQINATRDRMMHVASKHLRNDFIKAMGHKFHVRKVDVEFLGRCQTRHILSTMRVRVTTTTERAAGGQADSDGLALISRALMIPLILVLIVLLLCMIVLMLCCLHHKRGRKRTKYSDFATKSRPVVFPDEVPHRDENSSADGSLATVTTPMLVEREQPPEQPPVMHHSNGDAGGTKMMMTMHENPLYRPPPQTQAMLRKSPLMGGPQQQQQQQHEHSPHSALPTSPRLGYQHRPSQAQPQQYSTSSTFSPPAEQQQHYQHQPQSTTSLKHIDASPTPLRQPHNFNPFLRDHPLQQSMRVGLTPVGQRMPPPYLAH